MLLRHAALLLLLFAAPSCAAAEQDGSPPPLPADASAGDGAPDLGAGEPQQDRAEATVERAPDTTDASGAPDGVQDGALGCPGDSGEGDAAVSCAAGDVQRAWCGQCGVRQRACGDAGTWSSWSECAEDEQAECTPCATLAVGCGFCGTRQMSCEVTGNRCRWVLGACTQAGVCAPGDFETEAGACAPGAARTRWCQPGCAWGGWGACAAPPGWDAWPAPPVGGRTGAAMLALGDKVLVWGGRDAAFAAWADGALLDTATLAWTAVPAPSFPQAGDAGTDASAQPAFAGRSAMVAVALGARAMFWGGAASTGELLRDGAVLDPPANWTAVSATGAPSARAGASAVWDPDHGLVLVWGGSQGGSASQGGARYEPATDTWSPMASAPFSGRLGHGAVWDTIRKRMIVWGGKTADGPVPPERSGASYEPATDTWSPIADAPIARFSSACYWDAQRGRMLALLGEDGVWGGPRGDGASYDPALDRWSMISDLSLTGYPMGPGFAAAFGAGRAWVTGGDVPSSSAVTALGARYDPATDAWSRLPAMIEPRRGHAAAFAGRLVVWGGEAGQGMLPSAEALRAMP